MEGLKGIEERVGREDSMEGRKEGRKKGWKQRIDRSMNRWRNGR